MEEVEFTKELAPIIAEAFDNEEMIPFYFPILNKLVWFVPQRFNQKFAAFKQHNHPNFRNFVVLTIDEGKAVQQLLEKQ